MVFGINFLQRLLQLFGQVNDFEVLLRSRLAIEVVLSLLEEDLPFELLLFVQVLPQEAASCIFLHSSQRDLDKFGRHSLLSTAFDLSFNSADGVARTRDNGLNLKEILAVLALVFLGNDPAVEVHVVETHQSFLRLQSLLDC